VYALGFTNNPRAIDALVKLADAGEPDDYVRMAAIAGLGTLGAKSQFALLKSVHENAARSWEDRVMSLKSIGDLGTPEAKAYLQEQVRQIGAPAANDQVANCMTQVIALYLL
jgi:HEAT repeat protein